MNKKIVKWILIISGILVVLGLGIWGYKAIKNRNNDKNVVENENDLKEVASLKDLDSVKAANNASNQALFKATGVVTSLQPKLCNNSKCKTYKAVGSIYYGPSGSEKKLESSWIFTYLDYYYVGNKVSSVPSGSSLKYNLNFNSFFIDASNSSRNKKIYPINYIYEIAGKYLVVSLRTSYTCFYYDTYYNVPDQSSKECTSSSYYYSYPYTKVFYIGDDENFGKLIYSIPTNGNESITISNFSECSKFLENMCFGSDAVYYLESNYSDGSDKADIHKVTFGSTSFDSYKDEVVSTVSATIALNGDYKL